MTSRRFRFRAVRVFACLAILVAASSSDSTLLAQDRPPAVADQFYPGDDASLRAMLKDLFSEAVPSKNLKNVVALISPHAGYVFSGAVAASAYNQIDRAKRYENIFVLGPSHHVGFEGASVYTKGDYVTPMGSVRVNRKLGEELVRKHSFIVARSDAHLQEHSVEVQIPFLRYRFGDKITIVPMVVGASSVETCRKLAEALRPYFNPRNLFIISTDFCHYPSYDDARRVDKATADAILSRSPGNLLTTMQANESKGTPNLATSLCGWPCVLTLMYMTQDQPLAEFTAVQYRNSGDVPYGQKGQVVGYHAIAVSLKEPQEPKESEGFQLNRQEKRELLAIARRTIDQYVRNGTLPQLQPAKYTGNLKTPCGAFVTLRKCGELRGCIGRFDATEPLYTVVQQMAIASSTEDHRFPPVGREEIDQLEIEISVLTPMRRIRSIDEIELGRHGIYIRKGVQAGTFLPQVATETGWSKEEFLGHCAQEKAGLGWDGWKDAEIYVYEAKIFSEKEFKD